MAYILYQFEAFQDACGALFFHGGIIMQNSFEIDKQHFGAHLFT